MYVEREYIFIEVSQKAPGPPKLRISGMSGDRDREVAKGFEDICCIEELKVGSRKGTQNSGPAGGWNTGPEARAHLPEAGDIIEPPGFK